MNKKCKTEKAIRSAFIASLWCLLVAVYIPSASSQKKPLIFKSESDVGTSQSCSSANPIGTTSAYSMDYIHELERCYKIHRNAGEFANAALERNLLIAIGIEEIDAYYEKSQDQGRKRHELLSFLFDFLEIGASSAISIAKGERPQQLIAEGLSLFQGSRSAFNKDFKFLEWDILVNKMDADRSQIVLDILSNTGRDANVYSWETARGALQRYLKAGTITVALRSLSVSTGAEAKPLKDRADKMKNLGIRSAPTQAQYKAFRDNTTTMEALITRYTDADDRLAKAKTDPEKVAATKDKDAALENLKAIYKLIKADSALSPLLDKLPEKPGLQPAQKQRIQDSLTRLTSEQGTFEDYARVLQNLSAQVIEDLPDDTTLNERLQKILATSPK